METMVETIGKIGSTVGGGVFRGAYSLEEARALEQLARWMKELGLRTSYDAAGNLWGRIDGTATDGHAIVAGSHVDTVRNGGNYDGIYGILAGLLSVSRLLRLYGRPERPLEVVAFTGEEGSRFPIGLLGSGAVVGTLKRDTLESIVDDSGMTLAEAMRQSGLQPDRIGEAHRPDIAAFLELHIEQGPVLESMGIPIGIVQSIVSIEQVYVTVSGRADHAGTPMTLRRDALLGAACMIDLLAEIGRRSNGGVITVGRISGFPGSRNVVPNRVEFSIDVRHTEDAGRREMIRFAKESCERISSDQGLDLIWSPDMLANAAGLSAQLIKLLKDSCEEEALEYLEMPSQAGHDAISFALNGVPTGMLFIPCREGRSHSPAEFASPEDMEKGIRVLSRCLHKLAYS